MLVVAVVLSAVFWSFQPSVLALCLLTLEVQTLKSVELLEILLRVQKHSKVSVFSRLFGLTLLVMGAGTCGGPLNGSLDVSLQVLLG